MQPLSRLFRPRSVAVIGGGAWGEAVVRACAGIGFAGPVWPVHPNRAEIGGIAAFRRIEDLPGAPDAAFVGINRSATIEAVAALAARGCGGAVCFASGFAEAEAEIAGAGALQADLVAAAGRMRILGPNTYGFLNLLDGAALWPDRHGATRVARGVALVTQSSNIALNVTMQARGLPLAYVATTGNQAQTDLAEIGMALLEDDRVTALGLHIEGIASLPGFRAMAEAAHRAGKPVVALKVGASTQAQEAARSHTASLAGSEAGARALLERLGIGQVESLPALLEALKLLHVAGPLPSPRIAAMSCSGGEASLLADMARRTGLAVPPLSGPQQTGLRAALGPRVALANPLDYHTYIWGDRDRLAACFSAMMRGVVAMGVVALDFPRADRCARAEWDAVVDAVAAAQAEAGRPIAIMASLPETMPEEVAEAARARGIVAFAGFAEALEAIDAARQAGRVPGPVWAPGPVAAREAPGAAEALVTGAAQGEGAAPGPGGGPWPGPAGMSGPVGLSGRGAVRTLTESESKAALSAFGLAVPEGSLADTPRAAAAAAHALGLPVVLKGTDVAHKTEAGAVALGLTDADAVERAASAMEPGPFLVERMVPGAVAELLVGIVRDPAHGFVLTLGAGGTLTEILDDTASLLLPVTAAQVEDALSRLRLAPVLDGYRGRPAADRETIARAVLSVQAYARANLARLVEVEVNPLLCGPHFAVAADALITLTEDET
jgi:acyl-CoA synthetase (NDP forming)